MQAIGIRNVCRWSWCSALCVFQFGRNTFARLSACIYQNA